MSKITIDRKLPEQALASLEIGLGQRPGDYDEAVQLAIGTTTAIREALAQQKVSTDRIVECANRLVEHSDSRLGGCLSADSKAREIPSNAVSHVKARHLAALRAALAEAAEATP